VGDGSRCGSVVQYILGHSSCCQVVQYGGLGQNVGKMMNFVIEFGMTLAGIGIMVIIGGVVVVWGTIKQWLKLSHNKPLLYWDHHACRWCELDGE